MRRRSVLDAVAATVFLTALGMGSAEARPARCFTTDDGYFDCDFQPTDRDGSFTIAGPNATYIVNIERPGEAYAFVNLGSRNISLPGVYVRESDDSACWANSETDTRICAWEGRAAHRAGTIL